MSADLLRRAAAKIRETAEPVSGDSYPFTAEPMHVQIGDQAVVFEKTMQVAAFVNMWSPDVAELVADVLDETVQAIEHHGAGDADVTFGPELTLARRILGEGE